MKQNAEISATQDYYEFVCFDRMRLSTAKYDELRSTWRNRRLADPHVKLALHKGTEPTCGPECVSTGVTSAGRAVRRPAAMIVTESV